MVKGESRAATAASKTTKTELVAALKSSFDYRDPAYASMTDTAGAAQVKWGRWDMSKLGLLNWNLQHDNEMYGSWVPACALKASCRHRANQGHTIFRRGCSGLKSARGGEEQAEASARSTTANGRPQRALPEQNQFGKAFLI